MPTELPSATAVTDLRGLAMDVQAYPGGRRHDSTPMHSLPSGHGFITVGTHLERLVMDVGGWSSHRAGLVRTGLVAAGMLPGGGIQ
jgi:hypothetical protein